MSITFTPSRLDAETNTWEQLFTCDCFEKGSELDKAREGAGADDEVWNVPYPSCEICININLNMATGNALDLLHWLGITIDYSGEIKAAELAAACRRRLWDEPRNHDEGIPPVTTDKYVYLGREADYLRRRTADLLRVAEEAGEHHVSWA
ncbi:hypothetical protein DRQ25_05185 [Candidatus Fermentibacteria bacterium]|nr:MAG: hypothetical protein DRQ25_05185 [Candidatus Fermentibacteria bacterium]